MLQQSVIVQFIHLWYNFTDPDSTYSICPHSLQILKIYIRPRLFWRNIISQWEKCVLLFNNQCSWHAVCRYWGMRPRLINLSHLEKWEIEKTHTKSTFYSVSIMIFLAHHSSLSASPGQTAAWKQLTEAIKLHTTLDKTIKQWRRCMEL